MSYVKQFLFRGMLFGGFGPIVAGIVYCIIHYSVGKSTLSGVDLFVIVLSTYFLAFIHAGASVFPQIEHWSTARSLLTQLLTLYVAYTACYLVNAWIPFDLRFFLGYTAAFVVLFLAIWLTVMIVLKLTSKKINRKLL